MPSQPNLSDPTDLDGLRRDLKGLDPDARLAPLDMLRVVISDNAHLTVAAAVAEALAATGKPGRTDIVVLTDSTPILRDGVPLGQLVKDQLAEHHTIRIERLGAGNGKLQVDDSALDMATAAVKGADAVVTIGSGTMTDIGKVASERNGGVAHIVVQTAASVDGFTDNVSVVLRNGVKRTVPSRWPTIVLADVVTIGGAPREMNAAGFGEAISLFTAPADWYLSSLAGLDSTFHPASMAMLKAAAVVPPDWSAGIAKGEATATRELTRLLALRGIVSGVSNTTACLSGVEHVISHMLDLHHAANNRPIGLHGAQVGVASLVAAKLWRHAIESDLITPERLKAPDLPAIGLRVFNAFGHLGETDAIAAECWRDCQAKHRKITENWTRIVELVAGWKSHCAEFDKLVLPAESLRAALKASGAPATFAGLRPFVGPSLMRWAVANCHLMRNRFNLVDLLDLLDLWTDDLVDWALRDVAGQAA
jgi:glycerol-1-phosphate dehydrogenase [NAD(P)+]